MWQLTYAFLADALASLIAHALSGETIAPLQAVWFGLYVSPTQPINPNSTLANITEASYDGYVRQEVVWNPTYQDQSGSQVLTGNSLFFIPSDTLNPQSITGMFLASAATGGVLYGAASIPGQGYPLTGPQSALVVVPQIGLPTSQIYGGPQIVA